MVLVFIILGIELEMIAELILKSPIYANLLVTREHCPLTFLLLPFGLSCCSLFIIRIRRLHKKVGNYLKGRLLTFSGCQRNVSVTILLIPSQLGKITLVAFLLVAGVTFQLSDGFTHTLPHLSEEREEKTSTSHIAILNEVVSER